MYASTREFLDYFNLQSLDDLPTLAELRDIDKINAELDLRLPGEGGAELLAANDISADPMALAAILTADIEPAIYD